MSKIKANDGSFAAVAPSRSFSLFRLVQPKVFKIFTKTLKVSKFLNEFMMSSFLPKNEQIFLRISALASKKRSDKKVEAFYITN